jgi:hypothetical protein
VEVPREILNAVFLEWMERLQKCVQVDGEYVGWAKRTQYIEIDFHREIRLCYTWRGTLYIFPNRKSTHNSRFKESHNWRSTMRNWGNAQ